MGFDYTAGHAVETLLSGPAASALGGGVLTRQQCAVVVDIGGTTTDIALIEHGEPVLSTDGIRVGKWKTQVRGLAAASFALDRARGTADWPGTVAAALRTGQRTPGDSAGPAPSNPGHATAYAPSP